MHLALGSFAKQRKLYSRPAVEWCDTHFTYTPCSNSAQQMFVYSLCIMPYRLPKHYRAHHLSDRRAIRCTVLFENQNSVFGFE